MSNNVIEFADYFKPEEMKLAPQPIVSALSIRDSNHTIMEINNDQTRMVIYSKEGKPIVAIHMDDGTVEITEPGMVPEASAQFWAAIGWACPLRK